jgi:acyl dehydratase
MALENLFKSLRQEIGKEVEPGEWFVVDQDRVDQFAENTRDYLWIHTDVERATQTPVGGTIVHGFLILSLVPHLIGRGNREPRDGASRIINYGLNKVRFVSPVLVGSAIRANRTIIDVQKNQDSVDVFAKVVVEIKGVQKPACVAETIARIYL